MAADSGAQRGLVAPKLSEHSSHEPKRSSQSLARARVPLQLVLNLPLEEALAGCLRSDGGGEWGRVSTFTVRASLVLTSRLAHAYVPGISCSS